MAMATEMETEMEMATPKIDSTHPRLRAATDIMLAGAGKEFWGFSPDTFRHELAQRIGTHFPGISLGDPVEYRPTPATMIPRNPNRDISLATLFGMNGPIGSGKDTLADLLCDQYGFHKLSFATPLRTAASVLFNIPHRQFLDRDTKEAPLAHMKGMSPRTVLLLMGTEVGRSICSELWIKNMDLQIIRRLEQDPAGRIVIADTRFPNEADLIRNAGGRLIRISRPGCDSAVARTHASEAGIPSHATDICINNNGAIADLALACRHLIARYLPQTPPHAPIVPTLPIPRRVMAHQP